MGRTMLRLLNTPYAFWAILACPSIPMLLAIDGSQETYSALLHPTGEFAARFLLVALVITPLRMLLPRQGWPLWLLRRRRYLGVAAFGYALLHTIFYLIDIGSFSRIAAELLEAGIWTGWIGFFIFIPLAATSNNWAVRRLGGIRWKALQRASYALAVLTLAHWLLVSQGPAGAVAHFGPLAALEGYRLLARWRRPAAARVMVPTVGNERPASGDRRGRRIRAPGSRNEGGVGGRGSCPARLR